MADGAGIKPEATVKAEIKPAVVGETVGAPTALKAEAKAAVKCKHCNDTKVIIHHGPTPCPWCAGGKARKGS